MALATNLAHIPSNVALRAPQGRLVRSSSGIIAAFAPPFTVIPGYLRRNSSSSVGALSLPASPFTLLSQKHIPWKGLPSRERGTSTCTVSASSADSVPTSESKDSVIHVVVKNVQELEIEELNRPVAEYMTLPASQYSVLDGDSVQRIDENTFRCVASGFKLFAFEIIPVLVLRVEELPQGCCVHMLSCRLEGSPLIVAQNDLFSATMENNLTWRQSEQSPSARILQSDVSLQITIEVPPPFRILPIKAMQSTVTKAMTKILDYLMSRFLVQMGKDYKAWAMGDDSRQPVEKGGL